MLFFAICVDSGSAKTFSQASLYKCRAFESRKCISVISLFAAVAVFVGGVGFGHWVTNSDPAFLRILGRAEKYKSRYDAAKQSVPRVEVQ